MIDSSSQQTKLPHNKNDLGYFDCIEDQLQLKPVAALKSVFNHWIRSLVMEERFLALKVYSYPIPKILRKLLIKLQLNPIERYLQIPPTKQGTFGKAEAPFEAKKSLREVEKVFIESLVLVSDGYEYLDHICFEYNLLKYSQKVFDLLSMPVSNSSAKLLLQAINSRKTPQEVAEKLRYCASLQEVAVETINFLRQQILLRFRDLLRQPQIISQCLDEEKRKKKQFNTYFKNLSEEARKQMILLQCQSVQQVHHWFSFRQIRIDCGDLVKQTQILSKFQKKEFCNRIFRCKIRRLANPIIDYHQQIYNLWKSEVARNRKRKFSKKISEQKFEQSKDQVQKINLCKKNKKRHKKSNSVGSNQTNVTEHKKKQKLIKNEKETNFQTPEKQQILAKQILERQHQNNPKSQIASQLIEKKKANKKKKVKQQKLQEKQQFHKAASRQLPLKKKEVKVQQKSIEVQKDQVFRQNQAKEHFREKIGQKLQEFADNISQEANVYYDRRIIAFERIQFLLGCYSIEIQLFGSCACGIAIKNSDIDIAVKSEILALFEYLPQNLRLMAALQSLQQLFASQPFVCEMKVISTASIPIIKLKIDTSKPFLDENYGQIYQRLNKPHNSGIIQADITIQTQNHLSQSNHLGIISTQAINEWLAEIPSLRCIVISMKLFFSKKGFNQTYTGGLNTFSMIVLIVAYVYHSKMQKQTNPAKVLESMLSFYGYKFDQKQTGIDLLDQKSSIFFNKSQRRASKEYQNDSREKADLEILDPKCQRKNITRKCYLFSYIKAFFRQILQFCFQKPEIYQKKVMENEGLKQTDKANVFQIFLESMISQ